MYFLQHSKEGNETNGTISKLHENKAPPESSGGIKGLSTHSRFARTSGDITPCQELIQTQQ